MGEAAGLVVVLFVVVLFVVGVFLVVLLPAFG